METMVCSSADVNVVPALVILSEVVLTTTKGRCYHGTILPTIWLAQHIRGVVEAIMGTTVSLVIARHVT